MTILLVFNTAFALTPLQNYKNKTFMTNEALVNWIKAGDVDSFQDGRYKNKGGIQKLKEKKQILLLEPLDIGKLSFKEINIEPGGDISYLYCYDKNTTNYDLFIKLKLSDSENAKQNEAEVSHISVKTDDEYLQTQIKYLGQTKTGSWYSFYQNEMEVEICYCGGGIFDIGMLDGLSFVYFSLCEGATLSYNDISKNDWYYNDVEYIAINGYIREISKKTFSPDLPANRAIVAYALYSIKGNPVIGDYSSFDDVEADSIHCDAIVWAQSEKIVNGVGDNKFDPEGNVTRQDFAVMLWRYMKYKKFELPPIENAKVFADDGEIADYAREAVKTLNVLGIMKGKGNHIIDPRGNVTRAEAAAMLHRMMDKIGR